MPQACWDDEVTLLSLPAVLSITATVAELGSRLDTQGFGIESSSVVAGDTLRHSRPASSLLLEGVLRSP